MGRKIDHTGQRFGRLKVIQYSHSNNGRVYWSCVCECGKEKVVAAASLRKGHIKSCGCWRKQILNKHVHGHKTGGRPTRTYSTWTGMLTRCLNVNHCHYEDYGGRGIKVCERWQGEHGFENFLADMGERPEGKTLDRYPDKNGNYEPSNCRWASWVEQANNRRRSKRIYVSKVRIWDNGEFVGVRQFAQNYGLTTGAVYKMHSRAKKMCMVDDIGGGI